MNKYGRIFMDGLAIHATAKKHANVLGHTMGYFTKELSTEGQKELVELRRDFRRRRVQRIHEKYIGILKRRLLPGGKGPCG